MQQLVLKKLSRDNCVVNYAHIELTSLRLVVICALVGSITRAAPVCNMSTMCASRRLQLLEERLGLALFYRRKSGIELTASGRVVVEHSMNVLKLVDEMILAACEAPHPVGEIFENSGRPANGSKKLSDIKRLRRRHLHIEHSTDSIIDH